MKITVSELGNDPQQFDADWLKLEEHMHSQDNQLVQLLAPIC